MALYVGGTSVTGSQVLDATKLSGTLPALNASSLTNLDAADLTGSTNNELVTVTGANAIQGESTLTYDGTNLDMGDSKKIRLGDANDLEIYHNGSHSFIADNGGGSLIIDTNNGSEVDINSGGNAEFMGRFIKDGAVKLYHNGSEKLETASGGVTVTGTLNASSGVGVISAKDLGAGIHIKISDTGADVHSSADELIIERDGDNGMTFLTRVTGESFINFGDSGDNDIGQIRYHHAYNRMQFHTNATERVRIGSGGQFAISNSDTFASTYTLDMQFTGTGARMNRADDGAMLLFQSAGSTEGNVSISGSTCTYTTFTGAHWSQLSDNSKPTILKGTVMETINEMCDWYVLEFLNQDGKTTKEQHLLQEGQSAGDVINHTYEGEPVEATIVKEENNNLAKVKISDSEDSKAVYGVFQTWDEDNDMNVVGLGTFVIRVHSGETVAIGDLLSSKGDGTAKVQADDIMRARTIAKVTSTIKQTTYADDSYTVPCTLHCG